MSYNSINQSISMMVDLIAQLSQEMSVIMDQFLQLALRSTNYIELHQLFKQVSREFYTRETERQRLLDLIIMKEQQWYSRSTPEMGRSRQTTLGEKQISVDNSHHHRKDSAQIEQTESYLKSDHTISRIQDYSFLEVFPEDEESSLQVIPRKVTRGSIIFTKPPPSKTEKRSVWEFRYVSNIAESLIQDKVIKSQPNDIQPLRKNKQEKTPQQSQFNTTVIRETQSISGSYMVLQAGQKVRIIKFYDNKPFVQVLTQQNQKGFFLKSDLSMDY